MSRTKQILILAAVLVAAVGLFWTFAQPVAPVPAGNAYGPEQDAPAAGTASVAGTRRPSGQALSQWLQASSDQTAGRAADYQIDDPRPRDENGQLLPFRDRMLSGVVPRALDAAAEGSVMELQLFPDVAFRVRVTGVWRDDQEIRMVGELEGQSPGDQWSMSKMRDQTRALIEVPSQNRAYEIIRQPGGRYSVKEWLFSDVRCVRTAPDGASADSGMPLPQVAPGSTNPPISPAAVPVLNSRPEATAVIYLDFDGEVVSGTSWAGGSTINALPARMTAAQIEETWRRVANHFAVFDVNVTTDRSAFDAAPGNRKTHCIITPTTDAAPGAGGVAYLFSFTNPSNLTKVCWTFIDQDPADCALVCSHEIGHTLGLNHHGRVATASAPREEYYRGHGTGETGWGPFMGAPYGKNLLQWSRGEYARANNSAQDDLAMISTRARIPYLADDHGDTPATATTIQSGTAETAQIQRNMDSDFFLVELDTGPQPVRVTLPVGTMLDVEIRVYDTAERLLRSVNPVTTLAAETTFDFDVWEDVYIEVRGAGKAPVTGDGYSNYSSLGTYTLLAGTGTGTGPAVALSPLALPGFRTQEGSASPSASLLVRARRLTGPLTVRAPPHYEVSLDNATFSPSVQPTPGNPVHVRLGSSSPAGVRRGSVEASSTGATPRSVPVVGLVFGALGGSMSFIQGALEKLHYFDLSEPPSAKFQNDYTLQFVDYLEHFDGLLQQGVPDRQARADTIMHMMGYRPSTGNFDYDSGYLPVGVAYGARARLGLPPQRDRLQDFVRAARTLDERPVPVAIPVGGFNGLSGAPWSASYGMAAAFRDLFASREFRDRHGDVRLMTSSAFYNWLRDTMFPGRAMGADGPAALLDLLENGFQADYPTLSTRRAMARGAAAAFRSVYATVLLTEARGSNDGSNVEAPFQRRLHMAALRHQLWGDWSFHDRSPELSRERVLEILQLADIDAPPAVSVPRDGRDLVFDLGVVGEVAPINTDVRYSLTWADGTALPAAAWIDADGLVTVPAGLLAGGPATIVVRAENLAGISSRAIALEMPPADGGNSLVGLGAEWLASYGLTGCVASGVHDDGDNYCLVTEYAFGLDPRSADAATHTMSRNGDYMILEWKALKQGVSYTVESTTDLSGGHWQAVEVVPYVTAASDGEHQRQAVVLPVPGDQSRSFYRVVARFEEPALP